MNTIDVPPTNIRYENGEMIAFWPVFVTSQSLHRFGEQTEYEEKAMIPVEFASLIEQARKQNRRVRLTYRSILGPQKALSVQLI